MADALHSVRSLLCRATNETPQERFFQLRRNSTFGISVPTPGPVYFRRHGRSSKYDPVVEEVELVQLRSMRMFGSRLEEKRPRPCGISHLLGERRLGPRLNAEPEPALDTQFSPSRDPFDRPSIPPPEQAEASSEMPSRRIYDDDQNACNVRANDTRESEAGAAPSVPETSPHSSAPQILASMKTKQWMAETVLWRDVTFLRS